MAHLQYVWKYRCRLDLGPANAQTIQAQDWRPQTHCTRTDWGHQINSAAPITNNCVETMIDSRKLVMSDTNDAKYSTAFAAAGSLLGEYCNLSGEPPAVSMRANCGKRNRANCTAQVRRERETSVRVAMAATIALIGKIIAAGPKHAWIPVNWARAFNLTSNQIEKGTGYPRSDVTAKAMEKLFRMHPDPSFPDFPIPTKDDRMFLVAIERDFPRSQHDFAASCYRDSPRCAIGRWLWDILYRTSGVSKVYPSPELVPDPESVITSRQDVSHAIDLMREEAVPVIVAVVEGLRKSVMRPLSDEYFAMDLEDKAAYLAAEMCKTRPDDWDYDAPPLAMQPQRPQGSNDPERCVLLLLYLFIYFVGGWGGGDGCGVARSTMPCNPPPFPLEPLLGLACVLTPKASRVGQLVWRSIKDRSAGISWLGL